MENHLAITELDKAEAIRVVEITRNDLASIEQIATLTRKNETLSKEKKDLTVANSNLQNMANKVKLELSLAQKSLEEKNNKINQLFRVIQDIEGDKVTVFESKLVLAQRHVDNFEGWEWVD